MLLLNEFIDTLFSLNVNVPDLSSENIVFDEVRNRFVLIDGYGDKTLIPIREWCRPLNQKRLFSRFSEMTGAGYLKWDPHLRKFSLV